MLRTRIYRLGEGNTETLLMHEKNWMSIKKKRNCCFLTKREKEGRRKEKPCKLVLTILFFFFLVLLGKKKKPSLVIWRFLFLIFRFILACWTHFWLLSNFQKNIGIAARYRFCISLNYLVLLSFYNNRNFDYGIQEILCNDCDKKGSAPFHWLYHKCGFCGSYNTRVIKVESTNTYCSTSNPWGSFWFIYVCKYVRAITAICMAL